MATYTAAAGGGNWDAVATWGGAGYPVAGDTAIIASTSGTVVVNTPSACTTLTFQAAKTMTVNYALTVSGSVTFTGTCTLNGTATLTVGGITIGSKGQLGGTLGLLKLAGNQTVPAFTFNTPVEIASGTITWGAVTNSFSKTCTYTGGTMSFNAAHIASFASGSTVATSGITWQNVAITGTVTLTQALNAVTLTWVQSAVLAGAYDISVTNLRYGGNTTIILNSNTNTAFVAGQTVNVSTSILIAGNYPYTVEFKSTSAGTRFNLNYSGTLADCKIHNAIFTDVNANGNNIRGAWITRNNCLNINQFRNSDVGGAGAAICLN